MNNVRGGDYLPFPAISPSRYLNRLLPGGFSVSYSVSGCVSGEIANRSCPQAIGLWKTRGSRAGGAMPMSPSVGAMSRFGNQLFFLFRGDHGGKHHSVQLWITLILWQPPHWQKISVLQHDPSVHLPMRPGDPTPTSRNLDPLMHPFARARERTRALNAAKIERIFAKPFVASLEGHSDAVEVLVRKPKSLTTVASASWNGGVYFMCLCPLFFPSRP